MYSGVGAQSGIFSNIAVNPSSYVHWADDFIHALLNKFIS